MDEADRFKANPHDFLNSMFPYGESGSAAPLPSHIVLYDSLESQVLFFLEKYHYKLVSDSVLKHWRLWIWRGVQVLPLLTRSLCSLQQERRFFHAHFPVDRELQGHVLVFTLS